MPAQSFRYDRPQQLAQMRPTLLRDPVATLADQENPFGQK
jgi:hypothetical protein